MKFALLLLASIVLVYGSPLVKRQANPTTYFLPDSAELIVGNVKSTFNCNNRIYGYYADPDNECKIFHVCIPAEDETGKPDSIIYSFFCGNQTVFDQQNLVCAHPEDATPCNEAANLYDEVNRHFGEIPDNRLRN